MKENEYKLVLEKTLKRIKIIDERVSRVPVFGYELAAIWSSIENLTTYLEKQIKLLSIEEESNHDDSYLEREKSRYFD